MFLLFDIVLQKIGVGWKPKPIMSGKYGGLVEGVSGKIMVTSTFLNYKLYTMCQSIGYSEGTLGYAIRMVGSKKDPKCKIINMYKTPQRS